jgi:hypothetical protein
VFDKIDIEEQEPEIPRLSRYQSFINKAIQWFSNFLGSPKPVPAPKIKPGIDFAAFAYNRTISFYSDYFQFQEFLRL